MQAEVALARQSPIRGFPSLVLRTGTLLRPVEIDYLEAEPMRRQIEAILKDE